ncbi:tyrosine-protein kinase domain-containing protein [Rhizomonospora bruguierae]|uniref:tyrosine-protein kinase domain-containing protein n=1 Tax=Rhizomonospora bruguierae TaxID=1581705 RepID=UPI001BD190CB|nr:tyrosine-protein kinase domain-containing protein [Micromonospora sp. NBRC 107566]
MDSTRPSYDLSDYLGMFRRHWWVMLLLTAAGLGAAAAVTRAQPPVYAASTSVLVQPAGPDTTLVNGRTKGTINLDTEAQLVRSTAVAAGAGALLGSTAPPNELARSVAVEVPANTAVLAISYTAATPAGARAGSHAFAEAYLRNREDSARAELTAQATALEAKLKQVNGELSRVNARLAGAAPNSSQRAILASQRDTAVKQINSLTDRLNELSTATVSAGRIISDAPLPRRPVRPEPLLNLATGGALGLLLGVGLAVLRQRLDRRVRRAADASRGTGVTVLAALDRHGAPRFDDVLAPHGTGGRIFQRLRNEVLASLAPHDRVVLVTGASPGCAATLVAANLAASLARTGREVVLVGAQLPESLLDTNPLARIFGVAPAPGLSDVLAGRVGLAEAVRRAPRHPWLRVITAGGTASAAGLLQSQRLRDTLDTLRGRADWIVVEAPSTATGADAQSLASLADAAILAVEVRRTRRPEVVDAAEQLRRVGTPVLGAVILPRLPHSDEAVPPAPGGGEPAPATGSAPRDQADLDGEESTMVLNRVPGTGSAR